MSTKLKALLTQAIKFGLVGIVNTLIDWAVFALLTLLPFFASHYALTKAISYACGVANSLAMNKRFTFADASRMTARRLALFIGVNLAALGVSVAAIAALKALGLPLIVCNMLSTALSLAVNFIGNKLLVFRD